MDERKAVIAAEALLRECEEAIRDTATGSTKYIQYAPLLAKLAARAAPPEGEGKP